MMNEQMTLEQARMLSPLQLAYIGDSVHAMIVRLYLLKKNLNVKKMHQLSVQTVCAVNQSNILEKLLPLLTEDELAIVKRGRNAHAHHTGPKSASVSQYAGATGLETLLGFLYVVGNQERLASLTPYLLPED